MTEIRSGSDLYQVGEKVAETDNYRLYLCKQNGVRQCLLQIATSLEYNGGLDRAAYVLGELKRYADALEAEYASVKADPNSLLNYDLGFPELMDSFVCQEQGGRRINILAFRNVEDVSRLVPLVNITDKDRQRVDLRTSAWIMGKALKMFVLTNKEKISVGLTTGNNILVEPKEHYVVFFDWTASQTHSGGVPMEIRRQEISQAAQAVIVVLGGDFRTGIFPDDGDEAFGQYTDYLLRLARGSESRAQRAHTGFYKIVDSYWKREYYPFTTKSLK